MELKQAKGNTWYLADWQLIPLYRVDESRCILLDTGTWEQRERIERTLSKEGLEIAGILGSHTHFDHCSNHRYFQQKYHIPVALPMAEAAVACSMETLKIQFFMSSIREVAASPRAGHMQVRADRIIWPEETRIEFCGVPFEIVPTPGHSVGHTSVRTPDDVLYLADAMMAGPDLEEAKLPYHLVIERALETLRGLNGIPASRYLAAHRGVLEELGDVPARNIAKIEDRAEQILSLMARPVNISELTSLVCRKLELRSTLPDSVGRYERNVRSYLDFLKDTGRVSVLMRDGLFYYQRSD